MKTETVPAILAYYLPGRNYTPEEVPVEKLTHIIFSFTKVIDGEMRFEDPDYAAPLLKKLVEQKKRNPTLKVMIACGGWGADGFSDMALTQEGRDRFIKSTSRFIADYKLDGLDMDWEYPGISGAGTQARPADKKNFTALMKGLRLMLNDFKVPKILTFASAGWEVYFDHIELAQVMNYVDYTNVMTYDLVTGDSPFTAHHTPLGNIQDEDLVDTPYYEYLDSVYQKGDRPDRSPSSTKKIVDFLIDKGVAPSQIIIGSAFYGRVFKGVAPENNGLYQKSGGVHLGWVSYNDIRKTYENDPHFVRFWDSTASAPYMYNAQESLMMTYDDTVSIARKVNYAKEKSLGGIMFWELGNDTREKGSLLDAMYKAAQG